MLYSQKTSTDEAAVIGCGATTLFSFRKKRISSMTCLLFILFSLILIAFGKEDSVQPVDCDASSDDNVDARSLLSQWLSDDLSDETPLDTFAQTHFAKDVDGQQCHFEDQSYVAKRIGVLDAVEQLARADSTPRRLFIMLNGANNGVWLDGYREGCLGSLADAAARRLGVSALDQSLPKRLYTANGLPIKSDSQLFAHTHGLVHLLLFEETWVWPGIEIGFRWLVGERRMQTVSLAPRIVYVHNMLSDEECQQLMDDAESKFVASPVKVSRKKSAFRASEFFTQFALDFDRIIPMRQSLKIFVQVKRHTCMARQLPSWYRRVLGSRLDCRCAAASKQLRSFVMPIRKHGNYCICSNGNESCHFIYLYLLK
jgi:hypothetical protein